MSRLRARRSSQWRRQPHFSRRQSGTVVVEAAQGVKRTAGVAMRIFVGESAVSHPTQQHRIVPAVDELSTWLAKTLPTRAGTGADAARIADTLFFLLLDINGALAPTIGQPSVTLLFTRSLGQIASAHPWLAEAHGSTRADLDIAALSSVLARQSSADAAAGGYAFLETFYELLVGLVGLSLTERLLRSVWANHSNEPHA